MTYINVHFYKKFNALLENIFLGEEEKTLKTMSALYYETIYKHYKNYGLAKLIISSMPI